jgi:NitT/TauT family transport system ATP-binding protein
MDEPFGALDAQLRMVMHEELLKLWTGTRKTVIFVTHDLAEALTLADRIAVFSARPGRIRSIEIVYLPRPRDVFRIRFDPHFGALHDRLWSYLEASVRSDVMVS